MLSRTKKRIVVVLFAVIFLIIMQLYVRGYFSLEFIKHNKEILQSLVVQYYGWVVCLYIALYALAVLCLLPFISFISMLGGFLFGALRGTFFAVTGATLGLTLFVFLMRYFFKHRTVIHGSYFEQFNTMIERHGTAYLLCVRFIIVIPFFIVNSVVAFTTIPLVTIAWTTFIGIIPATLLFTFAGSQLEQIHHVSELISVKIILLFGGLAFIALIPIIAEKLKIKISIEK